MSVIPSFRVGVWQSYTEKGLSLRSSEAGGGAAAMDAAVFDLMGDDAGDLAKGRSRVKWDARKKKYVTLQPGASSGRGVRRITNESGAKVKIAKTGQGIFERWRKATNKQARTAFLLDYLPRDKLGWASLSKCAPHPANAGGRGG